MMMGFNMDDKVMCEGREGTVEGLDGTDGKDFVLIRFNDGGNNRWTHLSKLSLVSSGGEEPTWTYLPIPFTGKTVCLCCRRTIRLESFVPADNGLFTSKCSCGRTTTMYPADHPASAKLPIVPRLKAWAWRKSKPIMWSAVKHGGILYAGATTAFWAIHNQCEVPMTWLETAGWLGQELWSVIA